MSYQLNEGQSYTVGVTVVNSSTQSGQPVAATLKVAVSAVAGSTTILATQQQSYSFAPGESHQFQFPMTVPAGTGGKSGTINASLLDPAGNQLKQASADVVIAIPTPPLNSLYGTITDVDTGVSLSGVGVGLDNTVGGTSNDSGYYELSGMVQMYGIAKQWKTLSFTKTYYATITHDVSGLSGDVRMDVKMKQVLYPCPICGATFATKAELDAHLATAHLNWNFTGSLSGSCVERFTEGGCYKADISHSISNPSAPNFKWGLMYWDYGYTNTYQKGGNGPASGVVRCSGGAILYAHPNPSAVLQGYWSEAGGFVQTSDFKQVASINVDGL